MSNLKVEIRHQKDDGKPVTGVTTANANGFVKFVRHEKILGLQGPSNGLQHNA